jgi:hypothetical protein
MKETIELIVKVEISYPDKSHKKEAIKRAKECALACKSSWSSNGISCNAVSAKEFKSPFLRRGKKSIPFPEFIK